jgi:hypothetical protein
MLDQYLKEWDALTADLVWQPHPANRPQVQAYLSDAFETLYGGAAGGGKSDLGLGLARTMHGRSLLLRRTFPDLERSLISRSLEFFGSPKLYNSSKHFWNVEDRRIEFGHMERIGTPQVPGDEAQYASAPYDFIFWDQLEQFPQYPYLFMFSRARSATRKRVRILASANPVGEGIEWIMQRWRAWLIDETAKPGELLWYKMGPNNEDILTTSDDPDALSRTFIPAGLADNPYLGDDYRRQLANLPEPIRSALLYGNWKAMVTDDAYQVIPRAWVKAAMARWTPEPPDSEKDKPLVVGCDVARGGEDQTVNAPRRGTWYDKLQKHPGRTTPDGDSVVALLRVLQAKSINIDVIGVGASAYDIGRYDRGEVKALPILPVNFANKTNATDRSGRLRFVNKRAEVYWKFREKLDPANGENYALPPDPELEADLCAPRWSMQTNGIKIEAKEDIKKRIGRSPDCGDAVVLADADPMDPTKLVDFA